MIIKTQGQKKKKREKILETVGEIMRRKAYIMDCWSISFLLDISDENTIFHLTLKHGIQKS